MLANGTPINGPVELRTQLASHPETFVTSLTERLMKYSVNRPLEYFDMPQVRKIVRDSSKQNYTFTSLVLGIVNTEAFRKQGPPSGSKPAPAVTSNPANEKLPAASAMKAAEQRSSAK